MAVLRALPQRSEEGTAMGGPLLFRFLRAFRLEKEGRISNLAPPSPVVILIMEQSTPRALIGFRNVFRRLPRNTTEPKGETDRQTTDAGQAGTVGNQGVEPSQSTSTARFPTSPDAVGGERIRSSKHRLISDRGSIAF
jgi:hypothetical protein